MGNVILSIQNEVFSAFGKALLRHPKILWEKEPTIILKLTAMAKSLLRISINIVAMMQNLCKGLKKNKPGYPGLSADRGTRTPTPFGTRS